MHRTSTDAEYLDNGRVTIDADGIPVELGYRGTGFPEGNVSAPVGSIYTDTAATNGAIRWIKTSGTGNTGWRVEYGDTGERVFQDFLSEYTSSTSGRFISRTNENVRLHVVGRLLDTKGFADGDVIGILPAGFRPRGIYYTTTSAANVVLKVDTNGQVSVISGSARGYVTFALSHSTREPWPTSLPGIPS